MGSIRCMCEHNADAVRELHAAAFGAWWQKQKGPLAELPKRTRADVLVCMEKDPEGCFVAEEDGRLVGYIFSRTWGSVSWFGAFGVLPEYQGRGLGKQLIAASMGYLRRAPHRVIGLETMPESPYNLGLYMHQGFEPRFLTLRVTKMLDHPGANDASAICWSSLDDGMRSQFLADLQCVTDEIHPGLDYSKEIAATARHSLGETLVLTSGARAIGMSNVALVPAQEDAKGGEMAHVIIMALDPAHTQVESFRALVRASEAYAHTHGKQRIVIPVNAGHTWALEQLLGLGYRIERTSVRMVLRGTDQGSRSDTNVNLNRWAG